MQLSDKVITEAIKAFNNASIVGIYACQRDEMKAAIEAAIQAAWQPIETAPTDGTCILFVNKLEEYGICWWGREYDSSIKGFNYGWRSDSCEDFGGFETPTYWMELPKRKE
jgi:hypothetical protein